MARRRSGVTPQERQAKEAVGRELIEADRKGRLLRTLRGWEQEYKDAPVDGVELRPRRRRK